MRHRRLPPWIGSTNGSLATTRFYASAPLYAPDGDDGRPAVVSSTPQPKILTVAAAALAWRPLPSASPSWIELRLPRACSFCMPPAAPNGEQAAATVVSQLAAELSHDMRVPLTSIIASVELLEDELGDHPDGMVGALLDRTTRAADRMARMLEQNMDLGSLRATHPSRRAVDLARVVRQLMLDSAPLLQAAPRHGSRSVSCRLSVRTPTTCTPCFRTWSPTP